MSNLAPLTLLSTQLHLAWMTVESCLQENSFKTFCYDLSYGLSARFAHWARSAGALAVADGLGMLVEQAALSFAIWLGNEPETEEVYQLLVSAQMTVSSEVPRRRFIAGAVCPQCQALDRLVLEIDANNQEQRRHCVACGFSELMQAVGAKCPDAARTF